MTQVRPAARIRFGVGSVVAVALLATGCSGPDPVPGAQPPMGGEVQFTSDSGLLTINVPASWSDRTSTLRENLVVPGMTIEAAWILNEDSSTDESVVLILTYDLQGSLSFSEFVSRSFASGPANYPTGNVLVRETFRTTGGLLFERQDLSVSEPEGSAYFVQFAAIVKGRGIEIGIQLTDEARGDLDDVIGAVETLVMR